jgi:hypothetical protein
MHSAAATTGSRYSAAAGPKVWPERVVRAEAGWIEVVVADGEGVSRSWVCAAAGAAVDVVLVFEAGWFLAWDWGTAGLCGDAEWIV